MSSYEHLDLLSGYMGTLPLYSQKILIFNIQCFHPDQTIYQAEICSNYRILYFVLEGEQTVEVRAPEVKRKTLPENSVFQVGSGVPHRLLFRPAPRARLFVVYYKVVPQLRDSGDFEPFTKDEEDLVLGFLRQMYSAFPIGRRMRSEIALLDEYMSTRTCGDALKVRNQLANIFLSIFQQDSYEQGKSCGDSAEYLERNTMHMLLRQIIACAASGESLAQISERLHYTPRHIQRMVMDYYGESFTKVVNYTRLSDVMAMLTDTDLSLREIALRSGYSSVELMNRRFKQLTGMPLASFRRVHAGSGRKRLT